MANFKPVQPCSRGVFFFTFLASPLQTNACVLGTENVLCSRAADGDSNGKSVRASLGTWQLASRKSQKIYLYKYSIIAFCRCWICFPILEILYQSSMSTTMSTSNMITCASVGCWHGARYWISCLIPSSHTTPFKSI